MCVHVCVCVGVANVAQTIKGNVSRKFSSLTVGPNDSRPSHTFEEPCSRSKRPSSSHSRRSHQGTFVERASYCGLEGHALLVAPRKGLGRFRPPPRLRFPYEPATFPSRLFIRETALRNETKGGGVGSTRRRPSTTIGRAVGPRATLLSSRVGWLLASNGEVTDCLGKSRVQEHPFLVPPLLLLLLLPLPFHPRFFRPPLPLSSSNSPS